jgi:cysteine synthase
VGKYLKEKKPSVKIIGVEPTKAEHNLPGMKRISDLSEDLVPKILDKSLIDETIAVEDEDAYHTGIQIARKGGVLVGPTTGAILYAALQYAKEHKGLAVVISPDDAFKYVSFYAPYVKDSSKPKI